MRKLGKWYVFSLEHLVLCKSLIYLRVRQPIKTWFGRPIACVGIGRVKTDLTVIIKTGAKGRTRVKNTRR